MRLCCLISRLKSELGFSDKNPMMRLFLLSIFIAFFHGCSPIKNSFLSDYVSVDPCAVNGCIDNAAKAEDLFILPSTTSLVVKKLPDTFEISGKCSFSYFKKHIISTVVYSGASDNTPTINRNNDICNDTNPNNDRCIIPTHDAKVISDGGQTYVQCTRGEFSVIVPAVTSCPASPATCSMLVTFQIFAGQDSYDEQTSAVNQILINFID